MFSSRQIAAIVGLDWWVAHRKNAKKDGTGGRLSPETLLDVQAVARAREAGEEIDVLTVRRILDAGTSRRMLSRLSGVPETTILNYRRRADALDEQEVEA